MSDDPNSAPSDAAPGSSPESSPADSGGDLPTARPAAPASSPADQGARPTFDLAEDRCPKCGTPMDPTAVVCMKCGYDQRANVVREVETGVVDEPPAPAPEKAPTEFVTPGRIKPKALAIVGGVLAVGAMIAAGVFAPAAQHTWVIVGLVVLTGYEVALHTVTGVAAVAAAARLEGEKFGRLDFALGRMFVAFSLFELLTRVRLPLGWLVFNVGLPWLVAVAAYLGAVMILFRKDRATAAVIAIAHFVLWVLLNAGMELSGMVAAAMSSVPKT